MRSSSVSGVENFSPGASFPHNALRMLSGNHLKTSDKLNNGLHWKVLITKVAIFNGIL